MPSHTARGEAEQNNKSDGTPVSIQDWRANRLADALAKNAVAPFLLNKDQLKEIRMRDVLHC